MQSPEDELYLQNGSDRRHSSGSPLQSEQGSQRGGYISKSCNVKEKVADLYSPDSGAHLVARSPSLKQTFEPGLPSSW